MNLDELRELEETYRKEYMAKMKEARIKYATDKNKIKIGDIVSDHSATIKVDDIIVLHERFPPPCVYRGRRIKKDGTPYKSGERHDVYEYNIKKG